MWLGFLLKTIWNEKHDEKMAPTHSSSPMPCISNSLSLRDPGLFQKPEALPLLSMSQQEDFSRDLWPRGEQRRPRRGFLRKFWAGGWESPSSPAQWWACSDLAPLAKSPTRLDNRNIQQFISLRLNSFVLDITPFFSLRRILNYDLRLSISILFMKWHQKV